MKSKISTIHLQSPHLREQPKTHGCLSPPTEPTTEPIPDLLNKPPPLIDRRIFPSIALYRDPVEQAIRGGDREAAATIYPLHAIAVTPLLPEQPQDQRDSALDEEEWEIVRIVVKR